MPMQIPSINPNINIIFAQLWPLYIKNSKSAVSAKRVPLVQGIGLLSDQNKISKNTSDSITKDAIATTIFLPRDIAISLITFSQIG